MKVLRKDVVHSIARNINSFGGCLDYKVLPRTAKGFIVEVTSELVDTIYNINIKSTGCLSNVPAQIATIAKDAIENGSHYQRVVKVTKNNEFKEAEAQLKQYFKEQQEQLLQEWLA